MIYQPTWNQRDLQHEIEASDQIPHPLWVVIKCPPSRSGRGVECPRRCWSFDLTGTLQVKSHLFHVPCFFSPIWPKNGREFSHVLWCEKTISIFDQHWQTDWITWPRGWLITNFFLLLQITLTMFSDTRSLSWQDVFRNEFKSKLNNSSFAVRRLKRHKLRSNGIT